MIWLILLDTNKAADLMMERGAKSVRAICTHALLSGNAYEKVKNSKLKDLLLLTQFLRKRIKKSECIDMCKLFADVMHNVNNNQSINPFFIK
ncbi:MAG: hypothetical protein CM15mP102_13680 [Flavobacteriales bacterium]|nr:MAG: hypothetical protein CM15mP102_13680 [Flavobacteriales bacterium]